MLSKYGTLAIRYWHGLEIGTPNCLFNLACQCSQTGNFQWYQRNVCLLTSSGLANTVGNPLYCTTHTIAAFFKQRLTDQYVQSWYSSCRAHRAFSLLAFLKDTYQQSSYLCIVKDPAVRNIFTRFRITMNILESCTGRHHSVPYQERQCKNCNEIESVEHLLTGCALYRHER